MIRITEIPDREVYQIIAEQVTAQIEAAASDLGMSVVMRGMSYSPYRADFRVCLKVVLDEENLEEENFSLEQLAKQHGFTTEDLDRTFEYNNQRFKIIGFEECGSSYPVIVEAVNKPKTRLQASFVKNKIKDL